MILNVLIILDSTFTNFFSNFLTKSLPLVVAWIQFLFFNFDFYNYRINRNWKMWFLKIISSSIKTISIETGSFRYFLSKNLIMFILILHISKVQLNFRMEVMEIIFLPRKDIFYMNKKYILWTMNNWLIFYIIVDSLIVYIYENQLFINDFLSI